MSEKQKQLSHFDRALLEIIDHYGMEHQSVKLVEEVRELIEAMDSGDLERITEETSDVRVLIKQILLELDQIKWEHELDESAIKVWMTEKVGRQLDRMKTGK